MPRIAYLDGMASRRPPAAYNRVHERRRAVALACHFGEAKGLSIAQIAEHLGRSPTTVKAYFYDPSHANKRRAATR
jgi:DNA-binding NarL/FixJ family response regulator